MKLHKSEIIIFGAAALSIVTIIVGGGVYITNHPNQTVKESTVHIVSEPKEYRFTQGNKQFVCISHDGKLDCMTITTLPQKIVKKKKSEAA